MKTTDSSSEALIRQRMRFEALGNALKRASSMSSMFKVMFAITLIFGLPTLILLSNPLKDGTTFGIQLLVYGSRVLIVALAFYLLARFTPELYTAKNDLKIKIEEIGYQQADTNSVEEKNLLVRNILYSILKILVFIASGFGLFLISSRVNYGYIIGQQAIYLAAIVIILATVKFWSNSKPDYSPRLGGRLIVLAFVPATYFWAFEIIINFFSVITESNIRYNYTQSSFGFVYPFVILFLIVAVMITTKKTIREKTALQNARENEFKRVSTFIEEKGIFRKLKYKYDIWWNKVSQKISPKSRKENLDRKPGSVFINSIWITLFVSVLAVAFIVPWNIFPQDAMLFVSVLMISYQFSMIKYERGEIEVISEPKKNEEITPPSIRTYELSKITLRLILLPTIIFIVTQYVMSGILGGGILTADNRMLILLFTWIAVLIVLPTSVQMMILISRDLKDNRKFKNFKMYFTLFINILILELILYVITVVSYFVALQFDFQFIDTTALILQAVIVFVMVILPIVYLLISTKLDDKGYRILQICTWVLLGLIGIIIFEEFLHFVIEGYFLVQWPW
ncbi:MAG: hypothetical protein GOP50_10965 [Candidatus Heimdallarchaeota archaeon]|nr:hypothetical protein [Candidatus Heimdallarchaeota archaeon]